MRMRRRPHVLSVKVKLKVLKLDFIVEAQYYVIYYSYVVEASESFTRRSLYESLTLF